MKICQSGGMKRKFLALCLILMGTSSCGYTLRGNTRPVFDRYGIKTLYIPPVKNESYKAGAEITLYNAMRKQWARGGYVQIIDDPHLADATLSATIVDASYSPSAITTADQLQGNNTGPNTVQVASSYDVTLRVRFNLKEMKTGKTLWGDTIVRDKNFAATTFLGTLGSTSALINDSDFERTLSDMSVALVSDAEELINSIF